MKSIVLSTLIAFNTIMFFFNVFSTILLVLLLAAYLVKCNERTSTRGIDFHTSNVVYQIIYKWLNMVVISKLHDKVMMLLWDFETTKIITISHTDVDTH